ncbi:MAG: hypothetical protein EA358_04520 [Flavobacteriales bacterium]|nr:MAG: hypothetical protein EA358_04520 [Flavobacteriales bacterium]
MALDVFLKTKTLVLAALLLLSGCRDFREVDFFVHNNTNQNIVVIYRVRVCMGTQTSCLPRTFTDTIASGNEKLLYFQDNITTDFDIEEGFFNFEVEQNGVTSNYNFWKSEKLEKMVEDDKITYRLQVDASFF